MLAAFRLLFPGRAAAADIFRRHQKTVGEKGEEKELHPYNLPPFTDNKAGARGWTRSSGVCVCLNNSFSHSLSSDVLNSAGDELLSLPQERKGWFKNCDSAHSEIHAVSVSVCPGVCCLCGCSFTVPRSVTRPSAPFVACF